MSRDQETDRNLYLTDQSSGNDSIREYLNSLRESGEDLVKQLPSEIEDGFFIELEGLINSLYNAIDKELDSGCSTYKPKVLNTLLEVIDSEIFPAVTEWSTFVKYYRDGQRPRDVFANLKSIGRKIRSLHKRT